MTEPSRLESYHFYENDWDSYAELYESFEWDVPETFNVASYICDRWADDKSKTALFFESAEGREETYTFWQLRNESNQLANFLQQRGVEKGDRVAMTGVQKPETLVTLLATWKLGAVAVPFSAMFGTSGLEYRLNDSRPDAFVVDDGNVDTYREISDNADSLSTVLTVDTEPIDGEQAFHDALDGEDRSFETVGTVPEDPATIIYTSGTTGDPKGAVHPQRTLLGQLPGFVFTHMNLDIRESDVVWMVPEWSWIGLYGFIMPALFYGQPVVGYARADFEPSEVFRLVEKYGISYFNASPTAYRMMMEAEGVEQYDLSSVRALSLGAEKVGESIVEWVDDVFGGAAINVGYGQTECVLPIGECSELDMCREGSIGVPTPGHRVEILDPETAEPTVETGELGEIGVSYEGDPLCFKEYWELPETTAEKVKNGWLRTEDLGTIDEDGFIFFESRKDDVILSAGYRIGPEEVEESLTTHDAVLNSGVIGVPHDTRGEVVKAYVELTDDAKPSADIVEELQDHVKTDLAKYEYPREIEFVDELPKTSTGKIQRTALREREEDA